MNQDDINLLKQLGLTSYEAKAYITLSSLIQGTADEISDKSKIPRSKIYDVLKRLNSKEYIEIESGRPLTYHVKPPINVLKREKEIFNKKISQTSQNLNRLYEQKISQVEAPIWRISGIENIIDKELEIIRRSKKTINMRIGFLLQEELSKLIYELLLKSEKVTINIIISPYCNTTSEQLTVNKLYNKHNIAIYKTEVPFVKMIISDSKEMMHIYSKFSKEKYEIIPNTAIGIWNQYEEIANNYNERFENQIKKLKPIFN
ncbi:TrmB family transcriptional regulator [uncultured Methanobrevibacter sp.]|uniref:TrmB family transcriptional regulator n=1 Tax=uncultured Methanobrevibacter sp. TaxID=253161 RepID=UPI0026272A1A|nr:helix-turn-helix domain-containing protein [uncultured Methanobrevibacter sp.]